MSENSYSIIIPTYNNFKFIDECLNSVVKSFKNRDYEILVGIDNCPKTRKLLLSKSYQNTKAYWSNANVGPFTIKNNLVQIAKNDYLVFFDSDDIMYESCAAELHNVSSNKRYIRFKYDQFMHSKGQSSKSLCGLSFAEGVFCIESALFKEYVGFMPWRCAADSEFYLRLRNMGEDYTVIGEPLFLRRLHGDNLTMSQDTNHVSVIRKGYIEIINSRSASGQWDNPEIHKIELELL